MKKFIKMLFIGLFALGFLYGQEKQIELVPVYEKTFEDTIVDVIFDTATVSLEEAKAMGWKEEAFKGMKNSERTRIIYPKIVLIRTDERTHYVGLNKNYGTYVSKIKIYDKKGELVKIMDAGSLEHNEELIISSNGKYFCIAGYPEEYEPEYKDGVLYDSDGKKIWEIKYSPLAISNEGYAIAADVDWQVPPNPGGKFYLFNNKGELIKEIENPYPSHLAPMFAKFSDDGEWAIVVFKKETFPPTHISLIKKTGEIIWQKYFPDCRVSARKSEFLIIPYIGVIGIWDNQLEKGTGAYRNTEVFFIDWKGNLKWHIPLGIRGDMIVNTFTDKSKIYVATTEGYIWSIDTHKGKIIWTHKESWSPELWKRTRWPKNVPTFREIEIVNNKIYIIGGEWEKWRNSVLSLFDSDNGSLIQREDFSDEKVGIAQYPGLNEQYLPLIKKTKGQITIFKMEGLK